MKPYGDVAARRRADNSDALQAFGISRRPDDVNCRYRCIREASNVTIFTIGYERRDLNGLIAALLDARVDMLLDVRERPVSRKAEFRREALHHACEEVGLEYESWPELGSTAHQREQLRASGDLGEFRRRYRDFARRNRAEAIERLARLSTDKTIALLCYERCHEECHRSVIADLVAEHNDATLTAIL